MSTQQEIREGTVIRFLARDEGVTIEDAMDYWGRWLTELKKNPEHFGDCTKEPQTCNRCLIEGYYREVDNFLKWQSEQGVVITEPLIKE